MFEFGSRLDSVTESLPAQGFKSWELTSPSPKTLVAPMIPGSPIPFSYGIYLSDVREYRGLNILHFFGLAC